MAEIISEEKVFSQGGVRKLLRGWLCERDDGERVYYARRKHGDIFRSGHKSISGAMKEEVASWAIDEYLLINLRAKGVKYLGVRCVDTGDEYLTELAAFFDRRKFKLHDYTGIGRGGSRQRYVPLQHFDLKRGVVSIEVSSI